MICGKDNYRCGFFSCELCKPDLVRLLGSGGEPMTFVPPHPKKVAAKCVHLGVSVPNTEGGCRATYECERGHGKVRPCVECRSCEDFSPDDVV